MKNHRPGVGIAQPATEDRAHHRGHERRHGPERGRRRRLLLGEDPEQERLRQGHERAAREALHDAAGDQHAERARHAAERREGAEEPAYRAEARGKPPRQGHDDRLGHRVRGDDPSPLVGTDPEAAGDIGHRDVRDRHVEDGDEVRAREHDGREPHRESGERPLGCRAGAGGAHRGVPLCFSRSCGGRCRWWRSSRGRPRGGASRARAHRDGCAPERAARP